VLVPTVAGCVQSQFQSFVAVPASPGAAPRSQFHVHVQGNPLLDAAMFPLSPATVTWMLTLVGSLEVTFASSAVALAVFAWLSAPSLPGLARRTETFTFVGACWIAVAVVAVGV
jgi:hypothetical protein